MEDEPVMREWQQRAHLKELLPVERQIFSGNSRRFLGSDCERENSALDFCASGLQWLAGFLREGAGEFFFS